MLPGGLSPIPPDLCPAFRREIGQRLNNKLHVIHLVVQPDARLFDHDQHEISGTPGQSP